LKEVEEIQEEEAQEGEQDHSPHLEREGSWEEDKESGNKREDSSSRDAGAVIRRPALGAPKLRPIPKDCLILKLEKVPKYATKDEITEAVAFSLHNRIQRRPTTSTAGDEAKTVGLANFDVLLPEYYGTGELHAFPSMLEP
jgi:hypothetical protein